MLKKNDESFDGPTRYISSEYESRWRRYCEYASSASSSMRMHYHHPSQDNGVALAGTKFCLHRPLFRKVPSRTVCVGPRGVADRRSGRLRTTRPGSAAVAVGALSSGKGGDTEPRAPHSSVCFTAFLGRRSNARRVRLARVDQVAVTICGCDARFSAPLIDSIPARP